MVGLQIAERRPVAQHHPLGASTGHLAPEWAGHPRTPDAWEALVDEALRSSSFAIELAALSEDELPALLDFLAGAPALPFRFVSVHAPTKHLRTPEAELVAQLAELPAWVDAIVVHPDTIEDPANYRRLGSALVLENMDARKDDGRTAAELEPWFAALPAAGFCLDIAHVRSIDPTLSEADRLLDRFGPRLRHVHVSSVDAECHHVPLTHGDEAAFGPALRRCRDVPWILEAPLDG